MFIARDAQLQQPSLAQGNFCEFTPDEINALGCIPSQVPLFSNIRKTDHVIVYLLIAYSATRG